MVELKLGGRTIDLPYTVRVFGVTKELFEELVDADTKADLVDGVMIVHSPQSSRHNQMAHFLRNLLNDYVRERRLGVVLDPHTPVHFQMGRWVNPDLVFLAQPSPSQLGPKTYQGLPGVPDLVLDVMPPYGRGKELDERRRVYQDARVKEIWIVDPSKHHILVDRWQRKHYDSATLRTGPAKSAVVPGFWLDPEWLWSDPLPGVQPCVRKLLN